MSTYSFIRNKIVKIEECKLVSFSRSQLFSLQECWQSRMHITLITKKPSKEKHLGLPQTWIALIRTQSSLVGSQDQGLWGKVCIHFYSFAMTLRAERRTLTKSDIPLMLVGISEVWSLASDLVICSSPLGSTMGLFRTVWKENGDFHSSSCHSSLEQCFSDLYLYEPCAFPLSLTDKITLQVESSASERNSCNLVLKLVTGVN